jgi:hypothetical protein
MNYGLNFPLPAIIKLSVRLFPAQLFLKLLLHIRKRLFLRLEWAAPSRSQLQQFFISQLHVGQIIRDPNPKPSDNSVIIVDKAKVMTKVVVPAHNFPPCY